MEKDKLESKIETKEETLENYKDFKRRYYIYRADDIVEYIQRDGTELHELIQKESKMYDEMNKTLNPVQQKLFSKYSDNWMDILNIEVDELTKYILSDLDEER